MGNPYASDDSRLFVSLVDAGWFVAKVTALWLGVLGVCVAFGFIGWHFVDVAIKDPDNAKTLIGGIMTAVGTLVVVYGRKPLEHLTQKSSNSPIVIASPNVTAATVVEIKPSDGTKNPKSTDN